MYLGFMDMEKAYDRVNREALYQVLRMNDVGGKWLSGIESMHVNSLACFRVKGGENECFRIDSWVRQGCIMSPWLFNLYMGAVMKEVKVWDGERVEIACPLCIQITWFCVASRRNI